MIQVRVVLSPCAIDETDPDTGELVPNGYCKSGGEIVDPLITSEEVARVRGIQELQKRVSNRVLMTGTTKLHSWQQPGQIVDIMDNQLGHIKGYLESFSINISRQGSNAAATSSVRIEREEND